MSQEDAADGTGISVKDRITDIAGRVLMGGLRLIPYERRIPLAGWVFSRIVAPLAGYRKRIRENLALIFPDMDPAEVRRLCRDVPDNVGRGLVELFSGEEFLARVSGTPVRGPGVDAVAAAQAAGRPVIIVSGHFGNFNAARPVLAAKGYKVGALYRPMDNPLFHDSYIAAMESLSKPLFPRSRRGMAEMLRFLRSGGLVAILIDQAMTGEPALTFFGHPAHTSLSAAELALRYDAVIAPGYVIRKDNGLDFDMWIEAPLEHTDPMTMTQALNDSLEAQVRKHMDQWFWIHRRWKPARQRS